ncbi:fumarylacetoacetate hydrolase family protein [Xanthomonadaceae bacterium JHOS43]|nr:fumarylacetoacetate hydrolase family protein [Xanthomonadaceae bacterium JHOS43]MCX7562760.1 fumarylacetoacetate hydrolase family protein [Xanthomonadaceae bacterium XH05]
MSAYVFAAPMIPSVPVESSEARFPVHRIYCVGRNFAEHAREMGAPVERGTPVFFMKPADAVLPGGGEQPYPSATADLHHEVELVVAVGRDARGTIPREQAGDYLFGHALGLDLTRRDLQSAAKAKGLPWDIAKGFDRSAPISAIVPASQGMPASDALLWLEVNGTRRQAAALSDMIFSVADILHELSLRFELRAGDLIFMGTPAGVGALLPGDRWTAGIDGFTTLSGCITATPHPV